MAWWFFYPGERWIVKEVFIFLILSHSAPWTFIVWCCSTFVESCCLNSCSYSSNNKAVCLQSIPLPLYPLCYLQETAKLSKPFISAWRMGLTQTLCCNILVMWWHYAAVSHSMQSSNIARSHSLSPSRFTLIEPLIIKINSEQSSLECGWTVPCAIPKVQL